MNKLLFELASDMLQKKKGINRKLIELIDQKLEEKTLRGNWHPLGFIHLKLGTIENLGDLRLHIWSDTERKIQKPEMPIHNHVFTVNSHILIGRVINKEYKITKGADYRIYDIYYEGNSSILRASDCSVNCELVSISMNRTNDFYQVINGDYHESIVADSEFAATLVLATDKTNESPITLGFVNGKSEYVYDRIICEETTLLNLIRKLRLELLAKS